MEQNRGNMSFRRPSVAAKTIGLIGAPFADGQGRRGVDYGPKAIKDAGLLNKFKSYGWQVADYGDLEFNCSEKIEENSEDNSMKNIDNVSSACYKISQSVKESVEAYDHTVVLGGDHSATIGSIFGHAQANPDICVLWIDAHADLNTPHTSDSGNMHGMPLAFLIDEMQPYLSKQTNPIEWCKPCLSAKRLAYIGLRDVDPAERYFMDLLGIAAYTMEEVDSLGIGAVIKQALSSINPNNDLRIHVSFDIDAFDPSTVAPSTGTAVPGGLSLRDGYCIMEAVSRTGQLSVMDLMEVNPHIGTTKDVERTTWAANEMILAGIGKRRAGTLPVYFKPPARLD